MCSLIDVTSLMFKGNAEGKGQKRKIELLKSCSMLGLHDTRVDAIDDRSVVLSAFLCHSDQAFQLMRRRLIVFVSNQAVARRVQSRLERAINSSLHRKHHSQAWDKEGRIVSLHCVPSPCSLPTSFMFLLCVIQ